MIWNPRAEAQSPGDRAALQLARLKETLAWAIGRVPFYWERLGAARVERLDDLARLPFTRKSDLRAHYPFALHIAETLAEQGSKPEQLGLRYGMFGAEPWTDGVRRALEAGLGCPAYDIYGLSEIIGPGVSGECEAREGLHIADDHFLPEIVDPTTGEPLGAGEQGELVLTTLTKRAMPVVRYRTGDVTTLTTAPGRCGRTSARMARL